MGKFGPYMCDFTRLYMSESCSMSHYFRWKNLISARYYNSDSETADRALIHARKFSEAAVVSLSTSHFSCSKSPTSQGTVSGPL